MDARNVASMFVGAMVSFMVWIVWLMAVGTVLGVMLGGDDPRAGWGQTANVVASGFAIIFILSLPAIVASRLGAHVATRMAQSISVWQPTFALSLALQLGFVVLALMVALGA